MNLVVLADDLVVEIQVDLLPFETVELRRTYLLVLALMAISEILGV